MIYLVYTTDNLHSHASRELRGAYSSFPKAIKAIKKNAEKIGGEKLDEDDLLVLHTYNQTQGYEGEGEWDIEAVELNEWI